MAEPPSPGDSASTVPSRESDPLDLGRIGDYRLLQRLGSGGMGEVYEAEQEHPVRRRVALKLVRPGMGTAEVLARFESERQALALLGHPYIARVFDGGSTPEGRPYFVMEHVPGMPIVDYCDRYRLPLQARLRLFQEVCEGVQHAHQKGIIHRDLKSSNILVTLYEGEPHPKIIDFGVAKAMAGRLSEHTLHTQVGQVVGTLEYMSPEQAGMTPLDIDTRSDVYSLGVLLYELLVGVRPIEAPAPGDAGMLSLLDRIRNEEPIRPSARIESLGDRGVRAAQDRSIDAASWQRSLRGDLDWITLKALEKDRTRRYTSASDLSSDITRHLQNEPVSASPPSTLYRVRKFVRRHRVGVAAGAAIVLALILGVAGTTAMLVRALRAERVAREEAETALRTTDFLVDLFQVSDPSEARGSTITAREILDRGAERIRRELSGQPLVQARLMNTMANVYRGLGLFQPGLDLAEHALEIRTERLGKDHPDRAAALNDLSALRQAMGDLNGARETSSEALRIHHQALGPQHVQTAWSHYYLGSAEVFSGTFDAGGTHLSEALRVFRRELGPNSLPVSWCTNDLGVSLALRERYAEALPLFVEATRIKEKALGSDHPDLVVSYNNLAELYCEMHDLPAASRAVDRGLEISMRVLGSDHPTTAMVLRTAGDVQRRAGRWAEAESSLAQALDIFERKRAHHLDLPLALWTMAAIRAGLGRYAEAERDFRRSTELFEELDPNHPDLVRCLDEYARMLDTTGRGDESRSVLERAERIRARARAAAG